MMASGADHFSDRSEIKRRKEQRGFVTDADFRIRSRSELFTPFYTRLNGTITPLDFLDRSCYGKSLTNAVEPRLEHTRAAWNKTDENELVNAKYVTDTDNAAA